MIAHIGVETVSNTGGCDLVDSTIVGSLVHRGQGYFYCFEFVFRIASALPRFYAGDDLEEILW